MKDPKTEAMLEANSVDFVYMDDVKISSIDFEASLRNQARIDPPLYDETATQYTEAMKAGDEFPALVGYENEYGKIVLTDGNHRAKSYQKAGIETCDLYLIDAAADVIQALTYMANATHGRPSSEEERKFHAIHLRDLGYSNREAARWVGLTEYKVSTAWQIEGVRRRGKKLGVSRGIDNLPQDTRLRLHSISSDNTFKALATFIVASRGLTKVEVNTLIQQVKDATTEDSQLKVIEEFREAKRNEQRTEGRTKHRKDARRNLLPHLGYIHQQEPESVANATLTKEQRENLEGHLMKTVAFCSSLMKLLVEQKQDDDDVADDASADKS